MDPVLAANALVALRPGLAADGFDLRLGALQNDTVEVILEARPDACLDCLVPDELLFKIVESAVRTADASVEHVVLTKLGFDAVDHVQ